MKQKRFFENLEGPKKGTQTEITAATLELANVFFNL